MFSFLTGKIKIYLMAALAALLPILYVLGRRDGAKLEKTSVLEDELDTQRDISEFYKGMEQANNEAEDAKPRTRDELTDRLRKHGL